MRLTASVRRTGRAIVVHEASRFCGYGAEVAARLSEQCFHYLEAPVLRVAGFDIPYPPPHLEEYHLPSVDRILNAVDRLQWQETSPAVRAGGWMPAFLLPDLGEGLTEAEIVTWHVQTGDTVTVDQPIAEVETAKAVVEVPVPFAGRVTALHGQPGDVVAVGEPLLTVDTAESGNVLVGYGTSSGHRRGHRATRSSGDSSVPPRNGRLPVASPLIRQLARSAGVDLTTIRGSGRERADHPPGCGCGDQCPPGRAGCCPGARADRPGARVGRPASRRKLSGFRYEACASLSRTSSAGRDGRSRRRPSGWRTPPRCSGSGQRSTAKSSPRSASWRCCPVHDSRVAPSSGTQRQDRGRRDRDGPVRAPGLRRPDRSRSHGARRTRCPGAQP